MATQMVDIQPLKRTLGDNRYLELREWNGSKKVDLRFWKDGTVPTKEGGSIHLDQWKALCNVSDVIDDFLTRVIEKEPADWRYHIGTTFSSPSRHLTFVFISESTLCPPMNGPTVPPREVWIYTLENGKNWKNPIPLLEEREPELRQLVPLYRTDL